MLDLRRLRLLRELRERGTIAAVADALNYTPSAVSQQLSVLEREAGVPLLERVGRSVQLTDAALTLADHTDEVLAQLEHAEADLEAAAGPVRGRLRIAAFQTAARSLVAPVMRALGDRHPELRTELYELEAEDALPRLRAGDVDLVVAEEYDSAPRPRDPSFERVELGRDRIVLAVPRDHPLADAERPVRLDRLAGDTWISTREDTLFAALHVGACRAAGFEPDIRHRANDVALMVALAGDGHGVTLVPALGQPEAHPGVAVLRVAGPSIERSIFAAVRRGSAGRPMTVAAIEALRDRAAALGRATITRP
jgi:DNA-binding transcriptional LysR family regulator